MVSFLPFRIVLIIGLILLASVGVHAQTNVLQNNKPNVNYFTHLLNAFQAGQRSFNSISTPKTNHSIMLPSPTEQHSAPLFCRLENKINEGSKIQCLFRLGSASYVNYLEQKGDRQRLMLEQLQ